MKKRILIISLILFGIALISFLFFLVFKIIPDYQKKKENERLITEYRENKRIKFIEENNKYSDYEVEVAFLGDSLTDGCDTQKYYPDYLNVNRGIGGDRTSDVLNRLSYSVYDLKPQVIVLLIGGNNLDTMFNDYEDILKGFKTNLPNTKVILVSLTAMGKSLQAKNSIAKENNVKIEELANIYNYYYVNVYDALLNKDTNAIYDEYTTDGAHLTHDGYLVLTSLINNKLKEILNNE